jgi:hypothetical protein
VELKKSLNSHLSQLLREEEIKWYQRSKARNLLEGDSNTKYFHLLGNGRHRKMRIYQLQDGHNTIHGDNELKNGVVPHLVDEGLSILKNLKLLLCAFEKLSGLKINFHKSEIFCFCEAKEMQEQYTSIFGCHEGLYPFKYLGIPMHYRKLNNGDRKFIEHRIEKRLSSWKDKHLSVGGCLVLINSILTSLVMFMLSFFEVPKGVLEKR